MIDARDHFVIVDVFFR